MIRYSTLVVVLAALSASAQVPTAALTGEKTFQSPGVMLAQRTYFEALKRARTDFATDLDPAMKAAMTSGLLDEANAINELKKHLLADGTPPVSGQIFQTPRANDARTRFDKAVGTAQQKYAADLQLALKAAMNNGDLNEANAINGELKALSAAAVAVAAGTQAPIGSPARRPTAGLLLTRYPMHPSQTGGNRYEGYVPHTDLGKPLAASRTVRTMSGWSKVADENAVVAGLIRIDQPGRYEFRTDSGYDRNELLIDGKVVCKFRDGSNKASSVELRAGLLPIISVGYAHSTTEVRVQWKPPGAIEFSDIPSKILFH